MKLINEFLIEQMKPAAKSGAQSVIIEGFDSFGANYEAQVLAEMIAAQDNALVQTIKKPQDKTVITIEQIQDLYRASRAKSEEKNIKIIHDAQLMSSEAQNAFLKLLEEPQISTNFILAVNNADNVLPTLKSRCQIVRGKQLPAQIIEKYLQKNNFSTEEKKQILVLAGGSAHELNKLLEDKKYLQAKIEKAAQAKVLISGSKFEQIKLCNSLAGDRNSALEILELTLRILLMISSQQAHNQDYAQKMDKLADTHQKILANGNIRVQFLHAVT